MGNPRMSKFERTEECHSCGPPGEWHTQGTKAHSTGSMAGLRLRTPGSRALTPPPHHPPPPPDPKPQPASGPGRKMWEGMGLGCKRILAPLPHSVLELDTQTEIKVHPTSPPSTQSRKWERRPHLGTGPGLHRSATPS